MEGADEMEITKILKADPPQPKPATPKVEQVSQSLRPQDEGDSARNSAPPPAVSAKELMQAAKELEVRFNLTVKMVTDEATGREVVRIFSKDGERLLRQMPPDQVLAMADRARQGTLENILNSIV